VFPKRSVVNVAPFTVPLFPFPDASFALPQNGQYPTKPVCKFVGKAAPEQIEEGETVVFVVKVVLSPKHKVESVVVVVQAI
jgi:hypothetical protein